MGRAAGKAAGMSRDEAAGVHFHPLHTCASPIRPGRPSWREARRGRVPSPRWLWPWLLLPPVLLLKSVNSTHCCCGPPSAPAPQRAPASDPARKLRIAAGV